MFRLRIVPQGRMSPQTRLPALELQLMAGKGLRFLWELCLPRRCGSSYWGERVETHLELVVGCKVRCD